MSGCLYPPDIITNNIIIGYSHFDFSTFEKIFFTLTLIQFF